ncbi:MAG: NAD(P) transhydrogenase subunit alpha part 1 [Alphaproteobacteria bacterium MarineAlpha5_Bin11]|nr:NAD(P)(+) transhydrogenase (Re/Si-specific) subunit alpha [Pelagibacteraceae bacterium]PPR44306.1 MAG: NAD(P) transhydrogenase subunit alpha part 1 [Alphaproteobacteria bacterium MarineAlpha5_Bin11]PPR52018.1 MAG: NAD(P) transhydrogenase subunit alpha part 1 [Alphaproteobacteria bacterium MarineAlpha5_Bin10]|tara:strand:- start:5893 stop:7017 length:1125 start_codon:yes stop_codon:yes gene_type:complete
MKLSVLKEIDKFETRVATTPESVRTLKKLGFEVYIEKNAGLRSGYLNKDFENVGANITDRNKCLESVEVCLVVQLPPINDLKKFNHNTTLIGSINPYKNKDLLVSLKEYKITSIAMELIPRISRAQSMDVLSSQANLAGYRSVIDASYEFNKAFPMMMTAAGRINPAKVMVLGAGVAGLQAIATAKRLGAVVSATDVRPAVKEQVESLGAKFIMVDDDEAKNAETSSGYAKEMSNKFKEKQSKLIAETLKKQDIVICTALIPGRSAPTLVTEEMVMSMKPGSIIVDLAVETGGNCPLSKIDEVVNHNNIRIIGYSNMQGRVAKDASSLYAKNLTSFLPLIVDIENKKIKFDWQDEIINAVVITHNGKVILEGFK